MNRASGLERLAPHERDAARTTTLGTGELLTHTLDHGARHLVLTVGGSASTDGSPGMATTLSYGFFDERGAAVPPTGKHLVRVHRIDTTRVHPQLAAISCRIATDVTNPFYGPTKAAQVFAAQKDADAPAIARLDAGLLITGEDRIDAQTWQGKPLGYLLTHGDLGRQPPARSPNL